MSAIKITILLLIISCVSTSYAAEKDSVIVKETVRFLEQIKQYLVTKNDDSLHSVFISDTMSYVITACPDFRNEEFKYIWGTKEFDNRIIDAITNHWLTYIIPQNDSTIWTSQFNCIDKFLNQPIKFRRNKDDPTVFETIPINKNCKPGYGIRLIIKRTTKSKFKIMQIQFNVSC